MTEVLIKAEHISKRFGRRLVLNDISFELKKGDFLTIFGPNGVGKTTLIKILATIMAASSGQIVIDGVKAAQNPAYVRQRIGVISHNPFLYNELTAYENLRFYGKLYGIPELSKRIDKLLDLVELSARKYDVVHTFSRGMLQRMSIARALLHNPPILFLDEPHSGLDPHAAEILDGTVEQLQKQGTTFIMTTHNLGKGLELASRVIILGSQGIVFDRVASSIDPSQFKQLYLKHVGDNK